MDLRTRYTALMTLISQFVKFSGETLKRLEEEEVKIEVELISPYDILLKSCTFLLSTVGEGNISHFQVVFSISLHYVYVGFFSVFGGGLLCIVYFCQVAFRCLELKAHPK